MKYIRELTQKGDPRISVWLPKALHQAINEAAKTNKRRPQDEFIKRIAATLKTDQLKETQAKMLAHLHDVYQTI